LNRPIIDVVVAVTDEDAFACTRRLAQTEGVIAGASSVAALHTALELGAQRDARRVQKLVRVDPGRLRR